MLAELISLYILAFIYGAVIGSFLNVCIYRIPIKESIVTSRSHCMKCNNKIKWYDLVPLVSYIVLRGKCRYCLEKISIQYPLIELLNGCGYVLIIYYKGINLQSILFCLTFSVLIVISIIDIKTFEIPLELNLTLFVIGVVMALYNYKDIANHIIGFFVVSAFLYVLFVLTKGRGMGGGDIKLMAAAGLILGWKPIILALVLACIIGSLIHLSLMFFLKKERVLAFGPYLATGIVIAIIYGEDLIKMYINYINV